jgi:hypothetical protein
LLFKNEKLSGFWSTNPNPCDSFVYNKVISNDQMTATIHVDDLIVSASTSGVDALIEHALNQMDK